MYLGWGYYHGGEIDLALENISSSLGLLAEEDDKKRDQVNSVLQLFSSITYSLDPTAASRILGAAYSHHRSFSTDPFEKAYRQRVTEIIVPQIGEDDFKKAFVEGEKMSLNEAIELARSLVEKL